MLWKTLVLVKVFVHGCFITPSSNRVINHLRQLPSLIQQLQQKKSSITEEIELRSENISEKQKEGEGEDDEPKVTSDSRKC
jgi:hypothetical protein